jgi:radical SAM superfamily enzyme YgiQ (UPF0313 family)
VLLEPEITNKSSQKFKVLIVSAYELGRQPIPVATAASIFRRANCDVSVLDLATSPNDFDLRSVDVLVISCSMHTASRLGLEFARGAKLFNPEMRVVGFGLYASLLAQDEYSNNEIDYWIGGEFETGLSEFADSLVETPLLSELSDEDITGLGQYPNFKRDVHILPDRGGLRSLKHYGHVERTDGSHFAGAVEATRGCAHMCTHCPIPSVYGGKLRLVDRDLVLKDIDAQIELGAQHITFTDPDFFNAVPHSISIIREMRKRYSGVTFDATIKVEHLIEYKESISELSELGCLFITSAFESLNDSILNKLQKGHTSEDLHTALDLVRASDLFINPTWLPFTPWTQIQDIKDILIFSAEQGLVSRVPAIQYGLRLLVPPRSLLIKELETEGLLGNFNNKKLTYEWSNEETDALQRQISELVEAGQREQHDFGDIFSDVWALVFGLETPIPSVKVDVPDFIPGLTEGWFC